MRRRIATGWGLLVFTRGVTGSCVLRCIVYSNIESYKHPSRIWYSLAVVRLLSVIPWRESCLCDMRWNSDKRTHPSEGASGDGTNRQQTCLPSSTGAYLRRDNCVIEGRLFLLIPQSGNWLCWDKKPRPSGPTLRRKHEWHLKNEEGGRTWKECSFWTLLNVSYCQRRNGCPSFVR